MQISKRVKHRMVCKQEDPRNTLNVLNHHVLSVARPVQAKIIQPRKHTSGWVCVVERLKSREWKWRLFSTYFQSSPPLAVKQFLLGLLWTIYILNDRKPPPTSQSGTFTISQTSFLAGFIPTRLAELMNVQTTPDNSLTYGWSIPTLIWLKLGRAYTENNKLVEVLLFPKGNMFDDNQSKKLLTAAQYIKPACLHALAIWCQTTVLPCK